MGSLCMRRAMIQGFHSGFNSALGIALAYLFWAYVPLHGLGTLSHWIERQHLPLQIGIGLLALFKPSTNNAPTPNKGRWAGFVSTFLVVFLNPATLLTLTLLFTYSIQKAKHKITDGVFKRISHLSAFGILVFGVIMCWCAV